MLLDPDFFNWLAFVLPPYQLSAHDLYGPQYGAWALLSAYARITGSNLHVGQWQHGWHPPSHNIDPSLVLGGSGLESKTSRNYVWRKDQEIYLKSKGYNNIYTIGCPFLYLEEIDVKRVISSLLIVPPHSSSTKVIGICHADAQHQMRSYLESIKDYANEFDHVAVCVGYPCYMRGHYLDVIREYGYSAIPGAHISDVNSILRIALIFSIFEVMTSPVSGSHFAYAAYFGAKLSLFGYNQWSVYDTKYMATQPLFKSRPELLKRLPVIRNFSELNKFRVTPIESATSVDFGKRQLGFSHKQTPSDIRNLVYS